MSFPIRWYSIFLVTLCGYLLFEQGSASIVCSREPMASSCFPYGALKSKNPKPNNVRFRDLLVTRTGAFATLKENQRFSEPDGFKSIRAVYHTAKKHRTCPVLFAGDPYGTRTHVTTVKGWCLNRLTNGPYKVAVSKLTVLIYHLFFISCLSDVDKACLHLSKNW